MNNVTLIGNLTKDIEIMSTQSGKHVTQFSIGIRRDKDTSDFPTCVAWGNTADLLARYCHKGSKIGITGSIQTSTYEKNGEKRYKTIVAVSSVEFLNAKQEEQPTQSQYHAREPMFSAAATTGGYTYPENDENDYSLPF